MYAASYVLTQQAKVDDALDIMSLIGDKGVIDAVANAFTNEEYGFQPIYVASHRIWDATPGYGEKRLRPIVQQFLVNPLWFKHYFANLIGAYYRSAQ